MTTALTVLIVVVTTLLVVAAVLTAVVGVWIGRHATRIGRVATRQARAGWSTARAAVPSDAREIRLQRARLERELAATSNAWDAGRRMLDRGSRKQLAASHDVLTRTARQLTFELAVAAADSDAARRDSWTPDLRFRVDAFVTACGSFRQGILLATGAYGTGAAGVAATAVVLDLTPASVTFEKEPAPAR